MSLNKNLKNKHIDEIFEFFKQDNLVAVYNNGITEIECKTANLDNIRIKKIRLLLENSTIEVHFASGAYYWTIESSGDNEKLYYDVKNILTQKHKELSNLTIDEWEEIYDYRSYVARKNKEFRKLQETDNSFLSKELEKKANCNCENEPVSSKCVEPDEFSFDELKKKMVEENWNFDEPPILPEGFFSPENYSDNDEHRDEEMLKAYQQELDLVDEIVEQSNTKQDAGKPKLSQIPLPALKAICEVDEYGAKKYSKGNWVNVEAERFIDATLRHIYAMQIIKTDENGQKVMCLDLYKKDEESGIEHIKHALCSLCYAVAKMED